MHTVSGSISLPSQGFFSPFPHGTSSLSVSKEYLALEDGPPIFSQDFTCPDLLIVTHNNNLSYKGLSPTMAELSSIILLELLLIKITGLIRIRSPLLTESRLISFPPGTEMFQFPGLAPTYLCIQYVVAGIHQRGFPHSDIYGSKPV